MRFGLSQSMRALSLAVLFLSAIASLAAPNYVRAFNGRYQLSNVVEQGTEVELTLTLTLINSSKTTVKGGIVAVLSTEPIPSLLASFSPIASLSPLSQVTVSQRLTISAEEYRSWQSGNAPRLKFLVGTGTGAVAANIGAYRWVPPGSKTN